MSDDCIRVLVEKEAALAASLEALEDLQDRFSMKRFLDWQLTGYENNFCFGQFQKSKKSSMYKLY